MESVLTDKDLDDKLAKYMKEFHEKLVELESKLKEKVEKKEFDDKMNKFVLKNTETHNNLKAEKEHLKKLQAELNVEVERKIEDDLKFVSIVARHVDEKLEWVKGDV